MDDKIQQVQEEALLAIENAKTMEELRDIRIQYLGKKGSIQALMSMMKDLSKEEKPAFGQKVNVCKSTVTESLDAKQVTLEASALSEKCWYSTPTSFNSTGSRRFVYRYGI